MKYIASKGAIIALMALMAFIIGSIIGSVQAKASDNTTAWCIILNCTSPVKCSML